jgi:hypothetical protein
MWWLINPGLWPDGEVVAVDEHQFAAVEPDRPPACCAHDSVFADFDWTAGIVTEIVDHNACLLLRCARMHSNMGVDRQSVTVTLERSVCGDLTHH